MMQFAGKPTRNRLPALFQLIDYLVEVVMCRRVALVMYVCT